MNAISFQSTSFIVQLFVQLTFEDVLWTLFHIQQQENI